MCRCTEDQKEKQIDVEKKVRLQSCNKSILILHAFSKTKIILHHIITSFLFIKILTDGFLISKI